MASSAGFPAWGICLEDELEVEIREIPGTCRKMGFAFDAGFPVMVETLENEFAVVF